MQLSKRLLSVILVLLLSLATLPQSVRVLEAEEVKDNGTSLKETIKYDEVAVHDPSIIKDGDTYYVFGSHTSAAKSKDLMNWQDFVNYDFKNHTLFGDIRENLSEVFEWAGNKDATEIDGMGIWAPDVYYNKHYVNQDGTEGAYLMYFSLSTGKDDGVNEHYRSLIGLAASKNIEGPYEYVDTVIYSGFRNQEGKSHYDNTDFNEVFPNEKPRSGYFTSSGSFNFDLFPNAIDPAIVDGKNGELYMVYGSWNGGIWVLELDQASGMPLRQKDYNGGKAANGGDSYFGVKVSGGYKTSGEGPYIEYHPETGYYHLYVTYGGLVQESNYNMRFFRSKHIYGPYVDVNGNEAYLNARTDNSKIGNRIMGSFEFVQNQLLNEDGKFYSYRVPGHNSVYYDKETGKNFLIFHTRFKDRGEGHAVRVHQILFDEEGWPLVLPEQYQDEEKVIYAELQGNYLLINQGLDNSNSSKLSFGVTLEEDGSVTGAHEGSWSFNEGVLKLKLGRDEFKGFVSEQSSSATGWEKTYTLSLIGTSDNVKGHSVIGMKIGDYSSEELLNVVKDELDLRRTENLVNNVNLPKTLPGDVRVSWKSSNTDVVGHDGKINRGDKKQKATLTANLTYGTLKEEKKFNISIAPLEEKDYLLFDFDGDLKEKIFFRDSAHIIGSTIGNEEDGTESYEEGIILNEQGELGSGIYLDGKTGIKLPDNLIESNQYSISYWLKADQLTMHTPTFFGTTEKSWLSVLPYGHNHGPLVWVNSENNWYDAISNLKISEDTWYHFALIVDEGKIKFLVDGNKVYESDDFPNLFEDIDSTFFLGVNHWDTPFKGVIDDLRVYPNRAIDEEEVLSYYTSAMDALEPELIANNIFNSIKFSIITSDVALIQEGPLGAKVSWTSSHPDVLSNEGVVNRKNEDVEVTLTATVDIFEESFEKDFIVVVEGLPKDVNYLYYAFDSNLEEGSNSSLKATTTQDKLHIPGGNEKYEKGIVGDAFFFDGSTGVRLPDNIIKGDEYTISFWFNAEELTNNTPAFFGAKDLDNWISILPKGHNDEALLWSGTQWYDGITNTVVKESSWYHYAVTVKDGNVRFYVNGEVLFEGENFPNIFSGGGIAEFALGVNYWDTPFKGLIDELIIYPKEAKSSENIVQYYESIMQTISPEEVAENVFKQISLPVETDNDLSLPTSISNIQINWSSSNPQIISNIGKVTRPKIGEKDVSVKLTASLVIDGQTFYKDFIVLVRAIPAHKPFIHYTFDNSLSDANGLVGDGKVTGSLIDSKGGNLKFKDSLVGKGIYLDGNTGIRLPDNMIQSNKYSVSFWMNPEETTNFTPVFFGARNASSWISFVPKSGHDVHNSSSMLWSGEQWYDGLTNSITPINAWSHVVFNVDNGKITVYLNGNVVHKGNNFPDVFSGGKSNVFALGVNYWDVPFKGMIDELRIIPNDIMSAQEIGTHRDQVLSKLTPKALAEQFFKSIRFEKYITQDIVLPTKGERGAKIVWKSSNKKYVTNSGKVMRPSLEEGDQKVRLTATFMLDGEKFTKSYDVIVKAKIGNIDSVYYSFDKSLNEKRKVDLLKAKTTGERLDVVGGKAKYKKGKVGDALYLDGSYGIRLPDGLIQGNRYSVSMWVKPDQLTDFSTTFFGAKTHDSWISFTPLGVGGQTVLWSGTQWYDGLTNFLMPNQMWTHVAFTVDHGKVNVYINGLLVHTGTTFPNIFDSKTEAVFALGVNYWDVPFKGLIDELIVETNRVMSSKEIYAYFDSTVGDDRFVRNINRTYELDFEDNIGNAYVTGDRIDNFGGNITYKEGVVGKAAYFDGASGLRLPDGLITSDTYSGQMWVYPEELTPFTPTIFGGMTPTNWINLPLSGIDGKTMLWSGENWYDAITPRTVAANRWSHLAFSVNKGHVKVYIDGKLEFEGTDFPDVFTGPNSFFAVGVNYWDVPYKGLIDEFKLYNNQVLSDSSIKAYYEDTKPDQDEFERNQEKTHVFDFEDNLNDSLNEKLEGVVVGSKINEEGGQVDYIEGVDGKALYLDGESGVLLPTELITSENYSVSLWIKPEEITAHTTTFFGAQHESSWISVVPESGEFTNGNTMVWSGTEWYDGNLGTQVPIDEWSHIAFTVNQGVLKAYLDGKLVFKGDDFPDVFVMEDSVFSIGVNYWDDAYKGSIDQLMIFDSTVLSDDEIELIYAGDFELDSEDLAKEQEEVKEKTEKISPIVITGSVVFVIGAILGWIRYKKKGS